MSLRPRATAALTMLMCGVVAVGACHQADGSGLQPTPAPTPQPTARPAPPSVPAAPIVLTTFRLTGAATADDGTPVAGVVVYLETANAEHITATDAAGRYRFDFQAPVGGYAGANTALMFTAKDGFETYYTFFNPSSAGADQVLDLPLETARTFPIGAPVFVMASSRDSLCVNNEQDWPGSFPTPQCHIVRFVAPSDGVLSVAVDSTTGAPRPGLELEIAPRLMDPCCLETLGNPGTIALKAGMIVKASVEFIPGTDSSLSFSVTTSFAASTTSRLTSFGRFPGK